MKYIQDQLEQIGFEAQRVKMVNVSAAMGVQFAQNAQEFSETISQMGPNPINFDAEEAA